jgi:hypothetical protein
VILERAFREEYKAIVAVQSSVTRRILFFDHVDSFRTVTV